MKLLNCCVVNLNDIRVIELRAVLYLQVLKDGSVI